MCAYGIIGYSEQDLLIKPSGSIWGDCASQELLDEGSGFFDYKDFKTRLPQTTDGASVTWAIDSGSFIWHANYDSVISLVTGTTSQDDAGIATRPLGPITPGSGQKVWFEALVSVKQITVAQGVFVGVTNKAGLGSKLLISAASATKNSNTIGTTSGGQSFYGFWLHGDTLTNFDAVWGNNLQAATGATSLATATNGGVVLANVLTPNITQYPNSQNPLGYTGPGPTGTLGTIVPTTPAGALVATATASQTVNGALLTPQQLLVLGLPPSVGTAAGASGFVKLGIRYDGQQFLYFYVNGAQTAKMAITAAQDQTSEFAGIVQIMAGTAATETLNVGFERTAAKLF